MFFCGTLYSITENTITIPSSSAKESDTDKLPAVDSPGALRSTTFLIAQCQCSFTNSTRYRMNRQRVLSRTTSKTFFRPGAGANIPITTLWDGKSTYGGQDWWIGNILRYLPVQWQERNLGRAHIMSRLGLNRQRPRCDANLRLYDSFKVQNQRASLAPTFTTTRSVGRSGRRRSPLY